MKREYIAIKMMASMGVRDPADVNAEFAVRYADALIKELNK